MMKIKNMIQSKKEEFLIFISLTVLILVATLISRILGDANSFWSSLKTVFSNAAPYIPLAIGVAIVISCGEIDLSVAGLFSLCGMIVLKLSSEGWPSLLVYLFALIVSLAIGALMGFLINRFNVPSLILTLGMSFFLNGLAFLVYYDFIKHSMLTIPQEFHKSPFDISWPWGVTLLIVLYFVKKFSLHWKYHIATGLDKNAARLASLPVERIKITAFMISSLLCCITSMLVLINYNNGGWDVGTGKGIELTAIAAAVIGGTRIVGGKLHPINVALAVTLWHAFLFLTDMLRLVKPKTQELAIGVLVVLIAISGAKKK